MPLIVHPISVCDVCYDGYRFTTEDDYPHAIPCGHVFCKSCLGKCVPSICPMCRKPFIGDRAKKLHVDPLPPDHSQIQGEETSLLQRLVLVSGENTPERDLTEVMEEVESWLRGRGDDMSVHRPLRCALASISRHRRFHEESTKKLKQLRIDNHRERTKKRNLQEDIDVARAVELNLLEQVQNVESQYKTQLEAAEKQLEELRNELSRYTPSNQTISTILGSNPLPPPPKPFVEDSLPKFMDKGKGVDRSTFQSHRYHKESDEKEVSTSSTGDHLMDIGNVHPGSSPHRKQGFIEQTPLGDWVSTYSFWQEYQRPLEMPLEKMEPNQHGYAASAPVNSRLPDPVTQAVQTSESMQNNNRALTVIPGAPPSQRVVPPPRPQKQLDRHAKDPHHQVDDRSRGKHGRDVGTDAPHLSADESSALTSGNRRRIKVSGSKTEDEGPPRAGPSNTRHSDAPVSDVWRFAQNDDSDETSPDGAWSSDSNSTDTSRFSVSDFNLTQPPAGAFESSAEGPDHNLSALLGVDIRTRSWAGDPARADQGPRPEEQHYPSVLRPNGTMRRGSPASSWGTIVTGEARTSQSSLGSLGLGVFANPARISSSDLEENGLGLRLVWDADHLRGPAIHGVTTEMDLREAEPDSSSEEDGEDEEQEFFTPRASSSSIFGYRLDTNRALSLPMYIPGGQNSASTSDTNVGHVLRPMHGRSVSHRTAQGSNRDSMSNSRNPSQTSGRRSRSGQHTLAPDPPPPTVSFIPPVQTLLGFDSSSSSGNALALSFEPSTSNAISNSRSRGIGSGQSRPPQGPTADRAVAEPLPSHTRNGLGLLWSMNNSSTALVSSVGSGSSSGHR